MARFQGSRERKSRGGSAKKGNRRDSGNKRSFGGRSRSRRDSGISPRDYGRERKQVEMTKVTCSECGKECEVPFKPTSTKPVYCDNCFAKKGKGNLGKVSSKDIELINEKLDKIMKALKIK